MELVARGHPVHTRVLSIGLAQRGDGKIAAAGSVLDLRKCGFVSVAGDLQGPGIVHQMQLTGVVDPATATLESLDAAQPTVALEASALSEGECCRDPAGRLQALVGEPLDGDFPQRLTGVFGGPRGCSHLLTLARLLASTLTWALRRDAKVAAEPRRPGERIFRRDLVFDGFATGGEWMQLAAQLTDLHLAPAPALARPMQRLAEQREIRVSASAHVPRMRLEEIRTAERRRGFDDFEAAGWADRSEAVRGLAGLGLGAGVSRSLMERFDASGEDLPLLDLLLNLTPAYFQCMAALSERWPDSAKHNPSLLGVSGVPDSCYMWRSDGSLGRARAREAQEGEA